MSNKHKKINRILFAAPRSGSGKTMFTCGFLNLLKKKGVDVKSYKCGPDYIDPMFHKKVLGIYGGNLDTFFCSHEKVAAILGGCEHEYAVIEGVMGIYDGIGGLSVTASGYDVATATKTPILLIIDAYGTGRTIISQIKGILADDGKKLIKGIILNKTSEGFYIRLKTAINDELYSCGYEARVLGYLPKLKDVSVDSRHLGLIRPDEIADIKEKIDTISDAIEKYCDVDEILKIMKNAETIDSESAYTAESSSDLSNEADSVNQTNECQPLVTMAVAMDEAFCFYYKENLELLKRLGVKIVPFSPIHDEKLPEEIDGLYIGGGYPELYLKELSENESMRKSIRTAIENGIFSIAECGGFMYLNKSISDEDGNTYEMVGVVDGECTKCDRLVRFGYIQLQNPDGTDAIKGHEFHYYDSTLNGSDMVAVKAGDDKKWEAMHVGNDHIWGFPHMYFESNEAFVAKFVEEMRNGRK